MQLVRRPNSPQTESPRTNQRFYFSKKRPRRNTSEDYIPTPMVAAPVSPASSLLPLPRQLEHEEPPALAPASASTPALDLSVASHISIPTLKHIALSPSPLPIPPTITIDRDWHATACSISPLRGRLVSGLTILSKGDDGDAVKTILLTYTLCTIPACKGELYKDPEFSMVGKQMGWKMEPLGNQAVGCSVHFTMGLPPRVVAVLLSTFPAKLEERVGVCTWRYVCPSRVFGQTEDIIPQRQLTLAQGYIQRQQKSLFQPIASQGQIGCVCELRFGQSMPLTGYVQINTLISGLSALVGPSSRSGLPA